MRAHRAVVAVVLTALLGAVGTGCGGTEPVAEIDDIPAGTTYVTLDSGFVEALGKLELTPGAAGAAKIANGAARFPVTGGDVTYFKPGTEDPYVQGELRHDGSGLTLESDDQKVALTDFVIDPGDSVLSGKVRVDGKVADVEEPLFFLDGRTLEPLREVEQGAVLEGTTVKLTAEAAKLLNKTFDTDALEEGLVIGVAKIVVRTRVS